jgi:hypothetical protein
MWQVDWALIMESFHVLSQHEVQLDQPRVIGDFFRDLGKSRLRLRAKNTSVDVKVRLNWVASGKRLHNYRKSPFLIKNMFNGNYMYHGKST